MAAEANAEAGPNRTEPNGCEIPNSGRMAVGGDASSHHPLVHSSRLSPRANRHSSARRWVTGQGSMIGRCHRRTTLRMHHRRVVTVRIRVRNTTNPPARPPALPPHRYNDFILHSMKRTLDMDNRSMEWLDIRVSTRQQLAVNFPYQLLICLIITDIRSLLLSKY